MQLVTALNAQSVSTMLIRVVVVIVVVLGIASVMVVSVVQKSREIGILRAMGATRGQVQRLFLLQGAIVGAAGSVLGLLLARAMIFLFTQFARGSDGQPLFVITCRWRSPGSSRCWRWPAGCWRRSRRHGGRRRWIRRRRSGCERGTDRAGGRAQELQPGPPNEAEVLRAVAARHQRRIPGPGRAFGLGKSTLLNILGLLERMTAGSYRLQGEEVADWTMRS